MYPVFRSRNDGFRFRPRPQRFRNRRRSQAMPRIAKSENAGMSRKTPFLDEHQFTCHGNAALERIAEDPRIGDIDQAAVVVDRDIVEKRALLVAVGIAELLACDLFAGLQVPPISFSSPGPEGAPATCPWSRIHMTSLRSISNPSTVIIPVRSWRSWKTRTATQRPTPKSP